MMFVLGGLGLDDDLAVGIALGFSALVTALFITRGVLLEARRQGWGSNIWPPIE